MGRARPNNIPDIVFVKGCLMMKISHQLLILFAFIFLVSASSVAQGDRGTLLTPTLVSSSTTNYYFAKPNELTITVDIMGFVQRPGRYEISNSVNLVNLLALAGGPVADGSLDDIKVTRLIEVGGNVKTIQTRLDLDDISKLEASALTLSHGDVIQVDRSGWSSFREGFSFVVSAAIVTGAIAQVIYLTRQ